MGTSIVKERGSFITFTTMDIGIIRELFPHFIEAAKILNIDADFSAKLETALEKIPPYQIGKDGTVQEWIEDWKPGPEGHNVSSYFPFYYGSSITHAENLNLPLHIRNYWNLVIAEADFRWFGILPCGHAWKTEQKQIL